MRHHRGIHSPAGEFGRAVMVAALCAAAAYFLYLVVGNAVLASGFLERQLNKKPDDLQVRIERPWTVFPGRVHLNRCTLRLQDGQVQFLLDVSDAHLNISLTSLLQKTFAIERLEAKSVAFRLRSKIEDTPAARARAKHYAPIEGFADPPLKGPKQPSSGKRPWTVRIENIEGAVRELWLQQFRYVGSGSVSGSFELEPGRRVWVENARATLGKAPLRLGRDGPLVENFEAEVTTDIREHGLVGRSTLQLFEHFSGSSKIAGRLVSLGFLNEYFSTETAVLSQGVGTVSANVAVRRGQILPDSRAEYLAEQLNVRLGKFAIRGDARITALVERAEHAPEGVLTFRANQIQLRSPKVEQALALISKPLLEMRTTTLAIHDRWKTARGKFDVPRLEVPRLRALNTLLGSGDVAFARGSAVVQASAELREGGPMQGQVSLSARDVIVKVGQVEVGANGSLRLALVQPDVLEPAGEYRDVVAELRPLRVRTPDGTTGPGSMRLQSARIPFESYAPRTLRARVQARFAEGGPVLAALGVTRSRLPKLLTDFLDLENLTARMQVFHDAETTRITLERAETDGLNLTGAYRIRDDQKVGAFVAWSDLVRVGFLLQNGKVSDLEPVAAEDWLDRRLRQFRLGSTSAARDTSAHRRSTGN